MIQFVCSMMLVLDFKVKFNGLFFKNGVRVSPEETSNVSFFERRSGFYDLPLFLQK